MGKETLIQVADIPEEGLFLNFFSLAKLIPEVDEYIKITDASGRLELHKKGADIEIKGHVNAKVRLLCDRCLEAFNTDIDTDFFYLLQPKEEFGQGLGEEYQLSEEDIDVFWYEEGQIKGEELFREQILLQLPMRVLCSDECKGLCAGCGVDLNKEQCKCERIDDDNPFAILAQLKNKNLKK